MKKTAFIFGLILILVSFVSAEEAFKENFEGDTVAWTVKNYMNALTMGVVSEGAGDSKQAYEIRRDGPKIDIAFGFLSPRFEVKGGKTYVLSMDMKNSYNCSKPIQFGKDKGPANRIIWLDSDGKEIGQYKIVGFGPPNEEWHKVTVSAVAPDNAVEAQIKIGTDYPDIYGGTYWKMDNITVSAK